jgi:prolyl-tRNA synthetase
MGCYGIGVGRLLAAAIEQNHDEKGMIFPGPIAPFQVHLVGLNLSDESVATAAEGLYRELWDQGIETLYDDRVDQTAGVKLNDADLLGLPVRLVVSPRNLRNGMVEIKGRREKEPTLVERDQALDLVRCQLVSAGVPVAAPKG